MGIGEVFNSSYTEAKAAVYTEFWSCVYHGSHQYNKMDMPLMKKITLFSGSRRPGNNNILPDRHHVSVSRPNGMQTS